ncbi:MAG: bifunctional nuclease family protein [Planctomycetota bacterium]|jgi:bifunctional DNase/RNase
MELSKILIQETSDHQVIFLKEIDGERTFPILIGPYEAMTIDRRVKKMRAPRPLTHDLLNATITGMGGELERIVVCDLQDNTFFAKLVILIGDKTVEIDARPSDAIALAVLDNTPIFVEEAVLEEADTSFGA